jgi:UDP-N-acetylglucosamine--N-acetylmuramyl-(pentapeptide) pyrophosphoryl-undecaprenol N-acetylglucosamine transferase
LADRVGLPFVGFVSTPVYKVYTPAGLKSLLRLLKASQAARRKLEELRPEAIFSTGGYASAPVVQAAKKLGIPFVIHEQNSVPGRTNKILGQSAKAVCTVFHGAESHFPKDRVHRTGMPVREEFRNAEQGRLDFDAVNGQGHQPLVLIMGGSQGSAALNDAALATAARMARAEVQWIHITGTKHFESTMHSKEKLAIRSEYDLRAYVDGPQMAEAMFSSCLAVCRSGAGSLTELAAMRKPGILVPYPYAHSQHQLRNAEEFTAMGAAEILLQDQLHAAGLEGRILGWLNDPDRIRQAQEALAEWDIVDSVPRILKIVHEAARS